MRPSSTQDEYIHRVFEDSSRTNAEETGPNSHSSAEQIGDTNAAPWRSLFFFTTKANIPILIAGSLASVISGAVSPAQSFLTGRFFDKLITYAAGALQKDDFMKEEKNYVFYLLIVASVAWISLFAELALWIAFGELQAKSARDRLFHGLLKKEIEWFDLKRHGVGALLPRLQTQIRALQLATSQPLGTLAGVASTAILSLLQAFILSWKLTLVTISTLPVILLAVGFVGRGMQTAYDNQNDVLTEAQKFVTNAFTAIETVKCFNAQHIEEEKYGACIARAAIWYYRAVSRNALQQALVVLLSVSMFVQGFYYGGILIAKGEVSAANVITTFMSALGALQAINAILPQLIVLEKGRNAASILRSVMADIQQHHGDSAAKGMLQPAKCQGSIELKCLTFSYPSRPRQPALRDVSMFLPAGELTFLIGRSGSGKSTLGQLLLRFYASSHGTILLDGINLDLLHRQWLRKNITLVEQTSTLFNDTVYQNIALGKHGLESATKDDVDNAVQFALLQSLVYDLPDGIETKVGYKGSSMSGGQRQRVALARARLRDTPVLILDESTSALDRVNRMLMMEAIRKWRINKTTIIITHDISQILPTDYLYILERGAIVEEGYRKHLEEARGKSFQSFLTNTTRAMPSPKKVRKATDSDFVSTDNTSSYAKETDLGESLNDPLEAQLQAGENRRVSRLPLLNPDRSPLPAFRTGLSYSGSPWTPFSLFLTSASPPCLSGANWSVQQRDIDSPWEDNFNEGRSRLSMALENLIQRTGDWAAESRKTREAHKRDRSAHVGIVTETRGAYERKKSLHTHNTATRGFDAQPRVLTLLQILSTLWPSIDWHTRAVLVTGFTCAALTAVATPVFSHLLSKLLKLYSIPGGDRDKSLTYSLSILAISVADAINTYIYHFSFEYVGQRWVDSIRRKTVERLLDQPRAFFEKEENGVSRLADCLDLNAEEMRNLLGRFSVIIWMATLMTTISLVWALYTQWKMTLVALATAPYIYGLAKAFGMVSEKWATLSNDAAEDVCAILTETFTNIKTVRALTLEPHFVDKYIKATNRAVGIGFRRAFYAGFFFGLSDSASSFTLAMVFYVGAKFVAEGVPAGDVMEVFVFVIFALGNLNGLLGLIPQITTAKDMASRLLRLANLPKDSHEHLGTTRILGVGDIVFTDTEFAYPSRPEHNVLKHLNMHIRPGTCTAIVGSSGSGKSTIANLLLKLYSTEGNANARVGDLTMAGRNIKRIDTTTLRSRIVPVSQTPTLFSATIQENIAYGLPLNSPYNNFASISAAAMEAGIHDFINSLPHSYSTVIGDGGTDLSGGQAQRIAIARALVRRPAVFILDEATSALDVESADLVRDTLLRLLRDRDAERSMTVIIITHSREMMEIAENIFVLENGRVVEVGSFDGLMERRGGALANLLSGGEWIGEQTN